MTCNSITKIHTTTLCILAYITLLFLTAIKPQSLIFRSDDNHALTSQPNIKQYDCSSAHHKGICKRRCTAPSKPQQKTHVGFMTRTLYSWVNNTCRTMNTMSHRWGLHVLEKRKIFCPRRKSNHDSLFVQSANQSIYAFPAPLNA